MCVHGGVTRSYRDVRHGGWYNGWVRRVVWRVVRTRPEHDVRDVSFAVVMDRVEVGAVERLPLPPEPRAPCVVRLVAVRAGIKPPEEVERAHH